MAKMLGSVSVVGSELFTWVDRMAAADLSSFQCAPLASRVYDDAADMGFVMRSAKTGREMLFLLVEVVADNDGDICGWNYCSEGIVRDGRVVAVDRGCRVFVAND